jgi:adenylate cyclase
VGAGLCTGEVEVGLLGGGNNLQYSVVGETVRKAHKVQSLSDELSAPVIMDEETYQATNGAVEVDDLGMVQPKGLPHEIRLYRARSVKQ